MDNLLTEFEHDSEPVHTPLAEKPIAAQLSFISDLSAMSDVLLTPAKGSPASAIKNELNAGKENITPSLLKRTPKASTFTANLTLADAVKKAQGSVGRSSTKRSLEDELLDLQRFVIITNVKILTN